MNMRYAKEEEIDDIKEIWNYCFNDEESFVNYYFNNKYDNNNTIVACEDKDIVSSLQLNQYKIKLDGKEYETSYVVGVSTFPQVRGRGYMKKIMEYSLNELYKRNQLVSILMPIDYRLYRKYGYEHCYDQLEYSINIEDLKNFNLLGRLYKASEKHIDDLIDINNLFLSDVNGNTVRDKEYYINLFKEVESENGHIYVYKDGSYKGYIIYFLNGDSMLVRELFYKDLDSLKSILKFIYNHNTQCKKVIISAPVNDKIRFVLENPKTIDIKVKPFIMGRVINVEEYLNGLTINDDIEISANVFIEDKFIKENNGTFNIKIKDKKVEAKKIKGECDLHLSINTFTQLAFSYIDIKEAMILNNINKNEKNKEVIDLFEKSEVNEFDFILMDIMMPKLNGLDATRKIRALKRLDAKTIPIIAMSANAFVEDIMNSKLAGMNMHLAKPLDETKLINALKQCKKDEE